MAPDMKGIWKPSVDIILDSIINASMSRPFFASALLRSVGVGYDYASFTQLSGDKKLLGP